MVARYTRLSLALALATPLAGTLAAQAPQYSAGTTKYRVVTNAKGSQTSPAGSQSFDLALREQLTVDLMQHAKDTVMATITLDSIALTSSAGAAPDVGTVKGAKFVTMMSPTGKVYSTKPPAGLDATLAQITDGIGRFLPVYRASLAQGTTWSDTTKGKITQQGMEMDRTIVSTYTVAGDTTYLGQKALKINRVTNTVATGSGTAQGTPIAMETTGKGTSTYFMSPNGAFLGATAADDVNSKITVIAQNVEIGVKQSVQTTVEAIK